MSRSFVWLCHVADSQGLSVSCRAVPLGTIVGQATPRLPPSSWCPVTAALPDPLGTLCAMEPWPGWAVTSHGVLQQPERAAVQERETGDGWGPRHAVARTGCAVGARAGVGPSASAEAMEGVAWVDLGRVALELVLST